MRVKEIKGSRELNNLRGGKPRYWSDDPEELGRGSGYYYPYKGHYKRCESCGVDSY